MEKMILTPFQEDSMNLKAIIDLRGGNIPIPLYQNGSDENRVSG